MKKKRLMSCMMAGLLLGMSLTGCGGSDGQQELSAIGQPACSFCLVRGAENREGKEAMLGEEHGESFFDCVTNSPSRNTTDGSPS